MTPASSGLLVQRDDLRKTRWIGDDAVAGAPLSDGAVRFRIDSFALTSNNVTYAAFGEAMNYWRFFPADDAAWGRIPVWGFANVVESRCEGVVPGERFYGYWPLATHAVLHPERVKPAGFVDGAAHRRELHAVYNQYTRCSADPGYDAAQEAEQALLRPLYVTSFLIDDFLADNAFFGARRVLLSSASSKTAYGTAFCLSRRRGSAAEVQVIGLTSPANMAFTQGLGCYDQVLPHADVAKLAPDAPVVYVDFSGSASVRESVHGHFGDRLAYSCSVGGTHWDALGSGKGLPGPRPVLFFAPAQISKRVAEWGSAGLQERLAQAWRAFMQPVTDARRPWLQVVRGQGRSAVEEVYAALLEGRTRPQQGHVLTL
jgi:hypothetical protein